MISRTNFGVFQHSILIMLLVICHVTMLRSEESEEESQEIESEIESEWEVRMDRRHWHAADLACRRAAPHDGAVSGAGGGRLAVPRSRAQAAAIGRLLAREDPDAPMAFVGFNDLAENGEFITEDGEPLWSVGYARWHSWNYLGAEDDHCVAIDHFGLYWDVPCTWRIPFVCHRPPPPPPPPPTCPPLDGDGDTVEDEVEENGGVQHREPVVGSYSLESAARNWWGAAATCARHGRRLALPTSRLEQEALRDLLIASTPPGADDDPSWALAFVGVSDLARAGHRRTVLGEPFREPIETPSSNEEETDPDVEIITTLATGVEEDDENQEDPPEATPGVSCVAVNRMGEYELARCATPLPFFCEKPPPPPTPLACPTPAPTPPDPDLLPPPPGHFWLEHDARMSWAKAARACLEEGGVLAVPETTGEARAMADLLRSVPRPSDEDIGSDIWAYVGAMNLQDPENEVTSRNFTTIFGSELSWARWGTGQPNGAPGEQPCLVLDRAGTLWDLPCELPLGFFCRSFPAEPPWTLAAARAAPGQGWRVDSQEMRRWLRNMRDLGAGSAVPPQANDDGESQPEGEVRDIPSTARGFAHVDLRSWIQSFRFNTTFDFAPFVFEDRQLPSTIRF